MNHTRRGDIHGYRFFATVTVTSVLPDNGVFSTCTCFFATVPAVFLQRWCFLQHFPGVFCNSSGRLLRRSPGVFLQRLKWYHILFRLNIGYRKCDAVLMFIQLKHNHVPQFNGDKLRANSPVEAAPNDTVGYLSYDLLYVFPLYQ